ncbi:MAG: hypothetical protein ACPG4K_06010 [Haloferula sp.]
MSAEPNPPLASTRAELRNLRNNSQATVDELKAFLAELKGKSPQEMLGMVAGNQLIRATIHSLILIGAILVIFTIIPYLTREKDTPEVATHETEAPAETVTTPEEPPAAEPSAPEPTALDSLGIGEEKQAPPEVNPLDGDTGSFLDELE